MSTTSGEFFDNGRSASREVSAARPSSRAPGSSKPEPMPAGLDAWHAAWANHPGPAWVQAQLACHRPASAAIA